MTTVANMLLHRKRLESVSDSAGLDAELLLCHCLQKPRSYLRAWPEAELPTAAEQQFMQLLERREQGEPVAYLLGERGFWTLDLMVSPATLIPRPETELLVERVLALLTNNQSAKILDLGTGTGAIALALASEKPQWRLWACDVELAAVALAESNRKNLGLENVTITQSSWFESIEPRKFDLIVSNPPYIDPEDPHLQQGDVRFEPRSALVAANKGMADIEQIVDGAITYLNSYGWLVFEHGYNQGERSRALLQRAGFTSVFTERDLVGMERISGGRFLTGGSDSE